MPEMDPNCLQKWPGATFACVDQRCCNYPEPCNPHLPQMLGEDPEPETPTSGNVLAPTPLQVYIGRADHTYIALVIKNDLVVARADGGSELAAVTTLAHQLATELDAAYNQLAEQPYHDDQTLFRVRDALRGVGMTEAQAVDAIRAMQNARILFREFPRQETTNG